MASLRQIEANRRNALKSTGPRTSEGRARSAQNARKEGYTAEKVVLSVEQQPLFDRMHQDFTDHYQPISKVEEQFLLEMVWARWRIHRLWNSESSHLERALENACVRQRPDMYGAAAVAIGDEVDQLDKFARLEQKLTRRFNQAKANLLEAQQIRRDQEPPPQPEAGENEPNYEDDFKDFPFVPGEQSQPSILEIANRNHFPGGRDPGPPERPQYQPGKTKPILPDSKLRVKG